MFLTSLLKHADAQVERQNRPISITAVTGASDATYVIVLYDNGKMEGFGWNDKRIQWK